MTLNIDVKEANHHRHVNDIFKMIDDSTLPERVKYRSKKIFEIIGQAEAKIHGMSFEEVHFHGSGGNGLYYRYYWWVYCTRTTRD
ncbi:nickel insertion protein [Staphylococcus epidermidis]